MKEKYDVKIVNCIYGVRYGVYIYNADAKNLPLSDKNLGFTSPNLVDCEAFIRLHKRGIMGKGNYTTV